MMERRIERFGPRALRVIAFTLAAFCVAFVTAVTAKAATNQYGYESETGEGTGYVYNWPVMAEADILLQKVDADGNAAESASSLTSNGAATVRNAEFTVSFYGVDVDSVNSVSDLSGKSPDRTWVFRTDADGYVKYDPEYKVSGDDLYARVNADTGEFEGYGLPLGVLVIRETAAPAGYLGNDSTFVIKVVEGEDGTASLVDVVWPDTSTVASVRVVNDSVIKMGVKIRKVDAFTKTGVSEGDADMTEGLIFEIHADQDFAHLSVGGNKANRAVENGEMTNVKQGDLIYTLKGSEIKTETVDGTTYVVGATKNDLLPPGKYYVVESSAPTGYLANSDWKASFTVSTSESLNRTIVDVNPNGENALADTPIMGSVRIDKSDLETTHANPQGDATFEGAEFTIYNISENPVMYGGETYVNTANSIANDMNKVATITVENHDGEYYAETPTKSLPYGTYLIIETKAPVGYDLNEDWMMTVSIRENGAVYSVSSENGVTVSGTDVADDSVPERIYRGGLSGIKYDYERDERVPQGDATLAGAKIAVKNVSANEVTVNGETFASGEDITNLVLTTDETGAFSMDSTTFPYGTYELSEIEPSKGYLHNEDWRVTVEVHPNSDDENGTVYAVAESADLRDSDNLDQSVIRGGVKVGLVNLETMSYDEPGGAKLSGAEFTIYNASDESIVLDVNRDGVYDVNDGDKLIAKGESVITISTIETEGGQFVAQTAARDLPYGRYYIKQTKASEGFLLNTEWVAYFSVGYDAEGVEYHSDKDGAYVDITAESDACTTQVKRYDDRFVKKFATQDGSNTREMSNVAFVIVGRTSGEAHLYVTDRNGIVDTKRIDHSVNTNASDAAIDTDVAWQLAADGVLDELADELDIENFIVVDENAINSEQGYWFTGFKTGSETASKVAVNDSYGSVVYDDYVIYELRTSANEGMVLVRNELNIEDVDRMGWQYDRGTVTNVSELSPSEIDDLYEPSIKTVLTDENGSKSIPDRNVTLVDTILYTDFVDGAYVAKAEIHAFDAEGNDEGVIAEGTKDFNVNGEPTGRIEVEIEHVEGTAREGMTFVCFETVAKAGSDDVVAEHKDAKDADQTVKVVAVKTAMGETGTAAKFVDGSEPLSLTDVISYNGLETGVSYILVSELHVSSMDTGADGGVLRDANGDPVTATRVFTADSASGSEIVTFDFDLDMDTFVSLGNVVVAFETITDMDGNVIAAHTDINDANQTVTVTAISTHAEYVDGEIRDTIDYAGLAQSRPYTIVTTLHERGEDGSDLGAITDENGEELSVTTDFAPQEPNAGSTETVFPIEDPTGFAGKTVVIFETILDADGEVALRHADIDDAEQTVKFADIDTVAVVSETESPALVDGTNKIIDTITYANLVPGTEYTVKGELHLASITDEGTEDLGVVEGSDNFLTFTPENANGSVELTFEFDTENLGDANAVVVFETLYLDDTAIVNHSDISDLDQTVYHPTIKTTATDASTGLKVIPANRDITIADEVEYSGLTANVKYVLVTSAHITGEDGSDEGLFKMNGEDAISIMVFTPESESGSVTSNLEVDASLCAGKDIVIFEELYCNDMKIGAHTDINDADQTLSVANISTLLANSEDGAKTVAAGSIVNLTDIVTYENFEVGREYQMSATLHIVSADGLTDYGELVDADNNVITAFTVFTPETTDGSVDVRFEGVDMGSLAGMRVVAFERAYATVTNEDGTIDNTVIATHEDPTDESQTVTVDGARLSTSLADANGNKVIFGDGTVTLIDTVTYTGLNAGTTYTLTMTLMDGSLAEPIVGANGEPLTVINTFTPEASDGSYGMTIDVDASAIAGKTVVAFEELTIDGAFVAEHKDINDAEQTVTSDRSATLATTLTDVNGNKEIPYNDGMELIDTVQYTGLIPGAEYTMTLTFYDKSTGELLSVNGELIGSRMNFVPEYESGEVTMSATISGADGHGKTVVAFEELTLNGTHVAEHKDIEDAGQTVTLGDTDAPIVSNDVPEDAIANGDSSNPFQVQNTGAFAIGVIALAVFVVSVGGLVVLNVRRGKLDA